MADVAAVIIGASGSSGNTYPYSFPDSIATNTGVAITTATTTLVVTGTATQRIYVWYAGVQSAGSNSASTFNFGYGPSSAATLLAVLPSATGSSFTVNNFIAQWAGGTLATANLNATICPAEVPFVIPAGNNLYIVSAGTTINYYPLVYYSQH